jgi:tetratricopeptide (TPR) repeat protein
MFATASVAVLALQLAAVQDPAAIVSGATDAIERGVATAQASRLDSVLARRPDDADALLARATIARLSYDYDAADGFYNRIAASPSAAPRVKAYALLGQARSRLYRLPFDTAAAWFIRAGDAARAANDSAAQADALIGLAIARIRGQTAAIASPLVERAMRIVPRSSSALLAEAHCVRSAVMTFNSDARALPEGLTGIALARSVRDRRIEAFCLEMTGAFAQFSGNHPMATALLDTAISVARSARDRSGLAVALWWRGNQRLDLYQHNSAQEDLSAALEEAEASRNELIAGFAMARLAVLAWHFSDLATARGQLSGARERLFAIGDGWGMGYVRSVEGAIFLDAGDVASAEQAFREDLQWAEKLGLSLEQFTARFGLARVAVRQGDWNRALTEFGSAESIVRRAHLNAFTAQLQYEYGMLALHLKNFAEAERRFRAVAAAPKGDNNLDRFAARSRLAQLRLLQGDVNGAERELTAASDALDALRAGMSERELRTLVFQLHRGYDDRDAGFATVVAGLADAGSTRSALALVERQRARDLRDRIAMLSSGDGGKANIVTGVAPAVAAADLTRLMREGTAIAEYVTGSGAQPTTLFVVTRGGITARRLAPADSLAGDIAAFAGLIMAGADAMVLARELGQRLFAGALDTLPGVSRLVVVPDGVLHRVPFDALRDAEGRRLVEKFAVSLMPALSVAVAQWGRPRPTRDAARMLAMGDARFADEASATQGSPADVYREAFSAGGGLPRLPASSREVRRAARYAAFAEVRVREAASERYLKSAPLDSFDILHCAPHAIVVERSAARTALAVAAGGGEDGFLGPADLLALRLDAALVVLSACRTAGGVTVRGEGIQGLSGAFLAAGARAVLATQWRIRDRDAGPFMEDFYRAMAGGMPVSDALRSAKLGAIRRGASPAMWAAFTLVGDPVIRIPLREPGAPRRIPLVAAAMGAAVAAAYLGTRRKRRGTVPSSDPSASRAETVQ